MPDGLKFKFTILIVHHKTALPRFEELVNWKVDTGTETVVYEKIFI